MSKINPDTFCKISSDSFCAATIFVILQVHFGKIWQFEFGKITVSKRIRDYIRSFERAVFFLYIEK